MCLLLGSCSTKKNTAATRQWRAFTTRYNIYFNGSEAYKEALAAMENNYEDDYSSRLLMHPVAALAEKDEVADNAGFDRAIEKSQKAIKLRSITKRPAKNPRKASDPDYKAFLKRTEFNPFLHNAWLMMGRSQFYKGDFLAANATFLYIIRHFSWEPEAVAESRLTMARCYTQLGWNYEAENTLSQIEADKLPKKLRPLYNNVMADYLVREGKMREAIPHLAATIKSEKNKAQKARLTYLLAQLYAATGDNAKAYEAYGRVMRLNPSYRTYFNANIARTEVMPASAAAKVEKRLHRMERDARNADYLDRIFYAQGNLYLAQGDTAKAIAAYSKALEKSTRGGMDKAIAAIRLGDITFAREEYLKAQPAYAAAVSILPEKHHDYARVSQLSGVLDNLSTHAETVHLQDSLLALVAMPEAERMAAIQRVIDQVIAEEKAAQESARREDYEARKGEGELINMQESATPTLATGGDNAWYFYNTASISSGKTEFQRRWGSRKPEDNWRRRDKAQTMTDEALTAEAEADKAEADGMEANTSKSAGEGPLAMDDDPDAADPKKPEFYLKQLPFSAEEQASANELIREGLFNMGVIFNQQLDNLPLAIKTMLEADTRYPHSTRSLDIYYEVFLMYTRLGDTANAELYRQKILGEYPESGYGIALADPNYVRNLQEMEQRQNELYEQTYAAYLSGDRAKVHANYKFVCDKWPLSKLMPQFLFLEALACVGDGNETAFRENLERLTALYGESTPAPLASQMLAGLSQGRHINSSGRPAQGMIWQTQLTADGATLAAGDSIAPAFEMQTDVPHLLVLAFQTDSVEVNRMLFDVARYNFTNFLVKDFDLETLTFGPLSMVVIKGFNNFEELSEYRLRMALPNGLILPRGVMPVMISDNNFRQLLAGRSFDDYFNFVEAQTDEQAEKQVDNSQ